MGHQVDAQCLDCQATFTVQHGGGFSFHLLRCNRCGKTKAISFSELGELHLRYLKGLPGPYCCASAAYDQYVQEHVAVEPIGGEEYHKMIEKTAKKCRCRGVFTFDAPTRCPACRSTRIEEGGTGLCYD